MKEFWLLSQSINHMYFGKGFATIKYYTAQTTIIRTGFQMLS